MKLSLTVIGILLINIVIAQSPTKPTKEQTIQYIQNNLQGAVGLLIIDTSKGRHKEFRKVESVDFSFEKLTVGWVELMDKEEPGRISRYEQGPIPWAKLLGVQSYSMYNQNQGLQMDFLQMQVDFTVKEIKDRFYCPNANCSGFSLNSSITFPVLPSKVEGLKKAFLRLSEIAKEEKELF